MEFINHTIDWCKGEIFEGRMILLLGIFVLAVSLVYWKFGSTPQAMALLLLGLTVYWIDHFSEQRAEVYHNRILKALG